jgi:hypothetical protein
MGKDKVEEPSELIDILIQLHQKESNNIEAVIKGIEDSGGRILHVYPPYLIIARIPNESTATLKVNPDVHSVDIEEISGERIETASEVFRLAFIAWNEYLHKRSIKAPGQNQTSLSWDAPGRLPPDPPPYLREILRKREQDEGKGNSDLP